MDIERILRNTPATLTITFYGEESPQDADGAITITVKRRTNDAVVAGPTSAGHVGSAGSGQYQYSLAQQSNVDSLYATWTGTFGGAAVSVTTYVEIVGGFYFTLAELRSYDPVLASTTTYPTTKLESVRRLVENEFERVCRRAFVPRYNREILSGDGSPHLILAKPEPIAVLKLTVSTENWLAKAYASDGHRTLTLTGGEVWPNSFGLSSDPYNVDIEYEYGQRYCPEDVKEAALKRAKNRLVAKNARIDERATTMQVPDFGTFTLATPGMRGSHTGIPDVDVVLDDWAFDTAGGVY